MCSRQSICNNGHTGIVQIDDFGDSGCTSSEPCSKCQGDCNTDADCQGSLICHQREILEDLVPGCGTTGFADTDGSHHDYCTSLPGTKVPTLPNPGTEGTAVGMKTTNVGGRNRPTWTPVADDENAWLSIGNTTDHLCSLYRETDPMNYQGPSWGETNIAKDERTEVICCHPPTNNVKKYLVGTGTYNFNSETCEVAQDSESENEKQYNVRCCADEKGQSSNWISLEGIVFSVRTISQQIEVRSQYAHLWNTKVYTASLKLNQGLTYLNGPNAFNVGLNSINSKGVTLTTSTIAPAGHTALSENVITNSIPAPLEWTFDMYIKTPDFQAHATNNANVTYRTLLNSDENGINEIVHVTVRMSDGALGSYAKENSLTVDKYGKVCDPGFQDSGIRLKNSAIAVPNMWLRLTVTAKEGEQKYYINHMLTPLGAFCTIFRVEIFVVGPGA